MHHDAGASILCLCWKKVSFGIATRERERRITADVRCEGKDGEIHSTDTSGLGLRLVCAYSIQHHLILLSI